MKNSVKGLKKIWWAVKLFLLRCYLGNPSKKLKIIGVTGTNGKTTTVTLLYQIALALGYKAGLISTVEILNNGEKIDLQKRKIPGTTPDSISLTKLFAEMAKAGCEYVFMEVSSHAMDQNRVAGVKFTGGVFTNLTEDHLDYHKDFADYFLAKRKFFDMLPKGAFALSNDDDEKGEAIVAGTKASVYFYSLSSTEPTCHAYEKEGFCGHILKMDFNGLEIGIGKNVVRSKLLGKFNAYNLLAVWGASKLLGFNMEKVKKAMENVKPPTGRFDYYIAKGGVMVAVDYAHTPDALLKILTAVREIVPEGKKLISVFGCGGDRDPFKRSKMGKIGAELSDIAIFTSDNPRSEDPNKIIDMMQTDLSEEDKNKIKIISDRREAIKESVKIAQAGDIILCAGKGHEDYQEIKGVKIHFNDIEEFGKLLEKAK